MENMIHIVAIRS